MNKHIQTIMHSLNNLFSLILKNSWNFPINYQCAYLQRIIQNDFIGHRILNSVFIKQMAEQKNHVNEKKKL